MTPSGILESALYVDDLDAAEAFYRDVMGLERIARVANRHVFFRCGDGVLLLFNPAETVKPCAAARYERAGSPLLQGGCG
jgi:catechol 2,3-dioxygenase-like lactoylglutathione lyase family enzyme